MDTLQLRGLAGAVDACADRVAADAAVVSAALRAEPGELPAPGQVLAATVLRASRVEQDLRALASVVVLVARVYVSIEQQVAASFAVLPPGEPPPQGLPGALPGAAPEAMVDLLSRAGPDVVEGLLTSAPALAKVVVEDGASAAPGSDAGRLSALLASAASAAVVRTFLLDLGARRRRMLALLHPRALVAARAAPPSDRFVASRVLVSADLARLLARLAGAPPGARRAALGRRVAQRREWLEGSVVLRYPGGAVSRRRHQLLAFDERADGQVVEVLGDLDRARHLAVFVPGTGSDLQRYPGTLGRMLPFAAADPSVAVVLWQGADHPDQPFDDGVLPVREHVIAAAFRDAADAAGPLLAADVEGLRLAAPSAATDLTVIGHSYGGSMVGAAEAAGMVADRVVHVASAGGWVPDAAQYSSAATQRFSMTAGDDPIRFVQGIYLPGPVPMGHGVDPDVLPGVTRLATGTFDDGRPVRGHSAMFTPGSTAWRNLLATMTGAPVVVAP